MSFTAMTSRSRININRYKENLTTEEKKKMNVSRTNHEKGINDVE